MFLLGLSFGVAFLGIQNYQLKVINKELNEKVDGGELSESGSPQPSSSSTSDTLTIKKTEIPHLITNISLQSQVYIMEELTSSWLGSGGSLSAKGVDRISERLGGFVGESMNVLVDGGSLDLKAHEAGCDMMNEHFGVEREIEVNGDVIGGAVGKETDEDVLRMVAEVMSEGNEKGKVRMV